MRPGDWYWLDRGYACGAVVVDAAGIIVDACPIYRKLIGSALANVSGRREGLPG